MPAELIKNRSRMLALLYPKEGVSFEEFDKYWLGPHGERFRNLPIVKKNLLKYEQFHFNMELNREIAKDQRLSKDGLYKSPFYGFAVFEADSDEKILEIFDHPEYMKIIRPDELKFINMAKSEMIFGKMAVLIDK